MIKLCSKMLEITSDDPSNHGQDNDPVPRNPQQLQAAILLFPGAKAPLLSCVRILELEVPNSRLERILLAVKRPALRSSKPTFSSG